MWKNVCGLNYIYNISGWRFGNSTKFWYCQWLDECAYTSRCGCRRYIVRLVHTVGSIFEIRSLIFSNCPLDRLDALSLPWTGLPVAYFLRQIFVVDVGVNKCDVSWLKHIGALNLISVRASNKTKSSKIPKSLQICATSIGFAVFKEKHGCIVNSVGAKSNNVGKQSISRIFLWRIQIFVEFNRIL